MHVWSPLFEDRFGTVASAADLDDRPQVQVLGIDDRTLHDRDTSTVTVDTSLAALALIETGSHSGVLLRRFVERDLSANRLHTFEGDGQRTDQAHWIVEPRGRQAPSGVAVDFVEWLRAAND